MGNKARLDAGCLRQESVCVWGPFDKVSMRLTESIVRHGRRKVAKD
jgi:hypothetical protein